MITIKTFDQLQKNDRIISYKDKDTDKFKKFTTGTGIISHLDEVEYNNTFKEYFRSAYIKPRKGVVSDDAYLPEDVLYKVVKIVYVDADSLDLGDRLVDWHGDLFPAGKPIIDIEYLSNGDIDRIAIKSGPRSVRKFQIYHKFNAELNTKFGIISK